MANGIPIAALIGKKKIMEQVKNTLYYPFGGIALFSYEYYKYNPEMYLEIFPEDN